LAGGGIFSATTALFSAYRITRQGGKQLLLDTSSPSRFCADFEYIPSKGLLVIPTFTDNRAEGYRFSTGKE
jgi:hypothetical protein